MGDLSPVVVSEASSKLTPVRSALPKTMADS